ncbi:MAG: hypothetical protein BHW37_05280 [Firmicutes bacterium CAG:272_52_7]|nr:MAG: hypothetical protein BHW37_05280 [Firmicutes bacterium CAG:272_52_7]
MFSDIGKKIKNLAMLIMFIGCAGSVIYGLICFAGSIGVITGILIIVLGVIFSYLSVLVLYGFGTLIDDTGAIREALESKSQRQNFFSSTKSGTCSICGKKTEDVKKTSYDDPQGNHVKTDMCSGCRIKLIKQGIHIHTDN